MSTFNRPFENPRPSGENLTALLTCLGAKALPTDADYILQRQNPYRQKRGGLGFGGYALVQGVDEDKSKFVNINVFNQQAQESPLTIRIADQDSARFTLEDENEDVVANGSFLPIPSWGRKIVSTGKPAITILQQHGPANLVGVLGDSKCALFKTGEACKFCMMDGGASNEQRSVKEILEAFEFAQEDKKAYNLTLTTGVQASYGNGSELIRAVRTIKERIGTSPLAIELAPFAQNSRKILQALKEAGLDTFMMPLDCSSNAAQQQYLPGKASLLRESYWQNAQNAVEFFGRGNVTSSIIIGLEPFTETQKAIEQMLKEGIIPEPVPVRWDDSRLNSNQLPLTNPNDLIKAREQIRTFLQQAEIAGTIERTRAGCGACGGCGGIVANQVLQPQLLSLRKNP